MSRIPTADICDTLLLNLDGTPVDESKKRTDDQPFENWLYIYIDRLVIEVKDDNKRTAINEIQTYLKEDKNALENRFRKLLEASCVEKSHAKKDVLPNASSAKKLHAKKAAPFAAHWKIDAGMLQGFLHGASDPFLKAPRGLKGHDWPTVERTLNAARSARQTSTARLQGVRRDAIWTPKDIREAQRMIQEEGRSKEGTKEGAVFPQAETPTDVVGLIEITDSSGSESGLDDATISSRQNDQTKSITSGGTPQTHPSYLVPGRPTAEDQTDTEEQPFDLSAFSVTSQKRSGDSHDQHTKRMRVAQERTSQEPLSKLTEECRATLSPESVLHRDVINGTMWVIGRITEGQIAVIDSDDSHALATPDEHSRVMIPIHAGEDHWALGVIDQEERSALLYDSRPGSDAGGMQFQAYCDRLPNPPKMYRTAPLLHKDCGDSGVIVLALAFYIAADLPAPAYVDILFWRAFLLSLLLPISQQGETDLGTERELNARLNPACDKRDLPDMMALRDITELYRRVLKQAQRQHEYVMRSTLTFGEIISRLESFSKPGFEIDEEILTRLERARKFCEGAPRKLELEIQGAGLGMT